MMNNIILNGVNSNTINGLLIQELPPISKPAIRTEIEEIDGRDGDIITKLGYAAYDKEISIGLHGDFDINEVIAFFNTSGVVTFSNEPDKYYNYQIIDQIDFERLIRFRTATVRMHVQPFKYSTTESEIELDGTVITGEGTNLTLNNTEDTALFTEIELKGDTEQQTYTGKNLLNKSLVDDSWRNVNETTQLDTGVKVTCTEAGIQRWTAIPIPNSSALLGKTITVSANVVRSGNNNAQFAFYYVNTNNKTVITNFGTVTTSSNGQLKLTGTVASSLPSGTNAIAILVYSTANTQAAVGDYVEYNDLQLEIGSNITSYEPYVGGITSPNPSYPQEVKTVTGDNTITICEKNLFNINREDYITGNITSDGTISETTLTTFELLDTGFIIGHSSAWRGYITGKYNLKAGENYTLSFEADKNSFFIATYYYDKNDELISTETLLNNTSEREKTFTIPSNTSYVRLVFECRNANDNITFTDIQIEAGNTATDYSAYESQTYPISLGNIELCEINGAYDYIYKNNGTWYLHKVINKKIINGTENWRFPTSGTGYTFFQLNESDFSGIEYMQVTNTGGVMYSDKFVNISGQDSILKVNQGIAIQEQWFRISVPNTIATTAAAFKTWLASNNVTVYYLLATPTDTEITDSTLLSQLNALGNATTYLGVTNIITSGEELPPIIFVETLAVDDPVLRVTNSGNTTAKPIMTLYGNGTINLSLNGEQIFVINLSGEDYITIDVANMEAYYNGVLKNRLVTGNYENFVLNQGENEITFTGTLYSMTISNYSRWI